MSIVGNILWFIFGGFVMFILWVAIGIAWCVSIIGIPVGIQCFKFAGFVLWPFGRKVVYGQNMGSFLLNLIWIIVFGIALTVISALIGLVFCLSIIGIPFGLQFFKFAKLSLMPFGATIVKA